MSNVAIVLINDNHFSIFIIPVVLYKPTRLPIQSANYTAVTLSRDKVTHAGFMFQSLFIRNSRGSLTGKLSFSVSRRCKLVATSARITFYK